jgi:hypothetical protein
MAIQQLNLTWPDFQAVMAAQPTLQGYYVAYPLNTVPVVTSYYLYAATPTFVYTTWVQGAYATQFEQTKQTSFIQAVSGDAVLALLATGTVPTGTAGSPIVTSNLDGFGNALTSQIVALANKRAMDVFMAEQPVADPANQVWQHVQLTNYASTAEKEIIAYLVPAGKDFYVIRYSISHGTNDGNDAIPASLKVGASLVTAAYLDRTFLNTLTPTSEVWDVRFPNAQKIATAGQYVYLAVTPNTTTSTSWWGTLVGVLRPAGA